MVRIKQESVPRFRYSTLKKSCKSRRFDLSDFLSFNKVSQYPFHSSMNFTPSYTFRCQKTHKTTLFCFGCLFRVPFKNDMTGRGWCSDIVLFSLLAGQVTASGKKNVHESLGYTRLSNSDPSALFYIPYFLCNSHWLVIYWLTLIHCFQVLFYT